MEKKNLSVPKPVHHPFVKKKGETFRHLAVPRIRSSCIIGITKYAFVVVVPIVKM